MKLAKIAQVAMIVMVCGVVSVKPAMAAAPSPLCNGNAGVNTALGCIPVQMDAFVPWLMMYASGIAGGIAFLMMAYGFILMATSSGDPKAIAGAQETVTSAITGLLVSVFAVFILRLIVVGILKIPGVN
ncbi:hypothetical protein KBC75_01790 [Candidatus Shapirobacteria bacterium]|nr:hypothetical protein [Candidatus Shapirobacteria bacterium]